MSVFHSKYIKQTVSIPFCLGVCILMIIIRCFHSVLVWWNLLCCSWLGINHTVITLVSIIHVFSWCQCLDYGCSRKPCIVVWCRRRWQQNWSKLGPFSIIFSTPKSPRYIGQNLIWHWNRQRYTKIKSPMMYYWFSISETLLTVDLRLAWAFSVVSAVKGIVGAYELMSVRSPAVPWSWMARTLSAR